LLSLVAYTGIDEIMANLHQHLQAIQEQCMEIHEAMVAEYIAYGIEAAL
jgi:uncharacterized alpha-E superfamily protein